MKRTIRISMMHIAVKYDDVQYNVDLIERVLLKAVQANPDIILMPELAVSGYEFYKEIGIDWVRETVPEVIEKFRNLAKINRVAVILCSPKYEKKEERYFNSVVFISEQGEVLGEHHKVNVVPGSEGWSTRSERINPVSWHGHKIGMLICSDAYGRNVAAKLAAKGADVLISLAAWAPGMHGPNGEWEQRSMETGLCVYVCNRTGIEKNMVFSGSSSVVVVDGKRVISYSDAEPAILSVDVDPTTWEPIRKQFDTVLVKDSA